MLCGAFFYLLAQAFSVFLDNSFFAFLSSNMRRGRWGILKNKGIEDFQTYYHVLIERIMVRYKCEFVRISFVYLADSQLANVAVTNTFLILSRRLHQYPGENEEKVWALRYLMRELHRLKLLKGIGLRSIILARRR